MGFHFSFKFAESRQDLEKLLDFLMKQSLDYPNYSDWIQRTESEIEIGYKKAILAFSSDHLVGDLIYQPHKTLSRVRELKNMRIHPKVRRRYFAHFMLKQAETESKKDYDVLLCDVRSDQIRVINLMQMFGYSILRTQCLYDKNNSDVVMMKNFNKTSKSGILHKAF